jgi:hypothetical protein
MAEICQKNGLTFYASLSQVSCLQHNHVCLHIHQLVAYNFASEVVTNLGEAKQWSFGWQFPRDAHNLLFIMHHRVKLSVSQLLPAPIGIIALRSNILEACEKGEITDDDGTTYHQIF